jgi:Cys-tRNA(Pro)/Cys-tRNA(Cys) deacylase
MAKNKKLNSMRVLEQQHIPYEVLEYPNTIRDAVQIAELAGVSPAMVYKTLVVEPVTTPRSKPFLVMIAADRSLNLKSMATAAGVKKVALVSHKDAERLTGLQVGGISGLVLTHKHWDVYLDAQASEQEHIFVSAGQKGINLRVPTLALIELLRAKLVDVSK